MPCLEVNDEPEFSGGGADFFQRGIDDAHAGPAVDEKELAFQQVLPRWMRRLDHFDHRPDAEFLDVVALQHHPAMLPSITLIWTRPLRMSCGGTIARLR